MTLLASWISRNRALVAADTRIVVTCATDSAIGKHAARAIALAGGLVEGSKLLAMPHARLVLAHSGPYAFFASAFLLCLQQMGADAFDQLDEKLPTILTAAFESILEQRRDQYPDVPIEEIRGQTLLMAGWSGKRGRMCGVVFNQDPLQPGFRRIPLAGFDDSDDGRGRRFASPWSEASGPLPYASTPAAMEDLARLQMRDSAGARAGNSGGRLLVAELTRDTIAITSRCDLEPYRGTVPPQPAAGRPGPYPPATLADVPAAVLEEALREAGSAG